MKYDSITTMTPEQIAESCELAADMMEGHWCHGTWFQYWVDTEAEEEHWAYCIEGGLAAALELETITEIEDYSRMELIQCPVYDAVLDTLNHQEFQRKLDSGYYKDPDQTYLPSFGEGDLPNWNDTDGRTESEVVDLLRKTAKRVLLEAQEAAL